MGGQIIETLKSRASTQAARSVHSPREDDHKRVGRIIDVLLAHPDVSYQEVGDLIGLIKQGVCKIARRAGLDRSKKPQSMRGRMGKFLPVLLDDVSEVEYPGPQTLRLSAKIPV